MRHSLIFCLLSVVAFLLTACSAQSPEANLAVADANTERVSNRGVIRGWVTLRDFLLMT